MKKTFVLFLLVLCSTHAQSLHEFSLSGGFGLSTLKYNPTTGDQSNGLDKQFGFGYGIFVSPRFGFLTGLEFAFYSADYKLKKLNMQYTAQDLEEDTDFKFYSFLDGYKENQSAVMLQVPLMLQFQTGGSRGFYTAGGIKAALALSGNRSGKADVVNSGYYEEENYEYTEQNFRGFGKFPDIKIETNEKFKSAFFASMEMGFKWRFEDGFSIYTGVYFDYGLNNILKEQKLEKLPHMIEYNSKNPTSFNMNGMLNSKWENNSSPQPFVTKISPMAIGLKIKFTTGAGVDYFAKKEETEALAPYEQKRIEEEKQQAETKKQHEELLASAEKLMQEAQFAHEKAMLEQDAMQTTSSEIERLAAEKAQLEQEVARLTNSTQIEIPPAQPAVQPPALIIPEAPPVVQNIEPQPVAVQESTPAISTPAASGAYAVQVAITVQESMAQSIVNSLNKNGYNAYYKKVSNPGKLTGIYYRIRIGYFNEYNEASEFAKTRLSNSYRDWWIDRTENDTRGSY